VKSQRGTMARTAVLAVALLAAAAACGSSSKNSSPQSTASSSTPQTTPESLAASAAGKPCVARTGSLPSGAPDVPVEVGPPPTKLITKDLKVGTGPVIPAGATITTNYIGVACSTGAIFDSSYAHGQPLQLSLNQVIPGWASGIPGMKVGGVRLLGIPADQAYGPRSPAPAIAPNETLWFVVAPVKLG
jgi:peptidylprolyl isomerase